MKLWGFDNSTYVRTVKMVLFEKGVNDYEQVQLNVLEGEPKSEEHRERNPFGKVPVLDHDGLRLYETAAICQYLETVLPGRSVIPTAPKDRARMDMATGIIDSYGYGALLGVIAYHLFPDFIGGKDDEAHRHNLATGRTVISELMRLRGPDTFIAGAEHSVADYFLAPIIAYIALTPHGDEMMAIHGLGDWWSHVSALESFKATEPDMG